MKHKKAVRQSILLNRLTIGFIREDKIGDEFARFVYFSNEKAIENDVPHFLKNEKVRKVTNAFKNRIEDFCTAPIHGGLAASKLFLFYGMLFTSEKETILKFVAHRDRFNSLFSAGKYEEAKASLDACELELGESFWLIKNKLLVLFLTGTEQEMQAYCNDIKSRCSSLFTSYLMDSLILITQSNERL